MTETQLKAVAIVVVAAVMIVALLRFAKVKATIQSLFGKFKLDAENPNNRGPAISIKNSKSRRGGLLAQDETGQGANIEGVSVEKDIHVSVK